MGVVSTGTGNGDFVAPDGGWGWVIVISSLLIHVIMDGITYSLGTYLTVFTEAFHVTHGQASIVHSLLPAVTLGCGPIASLLTNKYGCRWTTILGSLIATVGFILSYFVQKFFYFYITIGVVVGIGFGLIYVPAIVSVGYYFDKKRSFATGIAVCGSGIGTFVLSPLNRILFDNYGVNGAFLITAGIVFNLVACGFLIRPIEIEPSEISKRNKKKQAEGAVIKRPIVRSEERTQQYESKNLLEKKPYEVANNPKILVSDENDQVVEHKNRVKPEYESLPEVNIEYSSDPSKLAAAGVTHHHANTANSVNQCAASMPMLGMEEGLLQAPSRGSRARTLSRNSQFKTSNSAMDMMVMIRSLQNIPVVNDELDKQASGGMGEFAKEQQQKQGIMATLRDSIDFSMLKNFVFIFFSISNFLTSLGFNTPFIYIVDQALLLNIPPNQADFLLSMIGISNMVGRIVLGVVSNLKGMNRLYLYSTVITICGIATVIEPFCTNFVGLLIYSIVFGFTSGGYVSITSVLLVDLFGLEKLTSAFGLLLVFQGVAVAIGPPAVGIMYDVVKSYLMPFVITGILLTISGVMCFFIPCFHKIDYSQS